MNKFADTEAALLYQADGVGLYRTEFGFSIRSAFPTEDEQYEFLKRAAERLHPKPITLRLLDIGADKELPYFPLPLSRIALGVGEMHIAFVGIQPRSLWILERGATGL